MGRWARQRPGSLLDQVGVVNHGRGPRFDGVHDALRAAGFAPELLGVDEAQSRWPGICFDDRVLVTTDDEAFEARRVIVTSGAWTNKLLGGILPLPRLGGPVIVGAGFSGHGFKFTPSVGRILADLAEGIAAPALIALER